MNDLKEKIIYMTKAAFKPFYLTILIDYNNPILFKYNNCLFNCRIGDDKVLVIKTKYHLPALMVREILGKEIITNFDEIELDESKFIYEYRLKPTFVNLLGNKKKIFYISDGLIPEEWGRMIYDFGINQGDIGDKNKEYFEYRHFNKNTNNNIPWMNILDKNIKNISDDYLHEIYKFIKKTFHSTKGRLVVLDNNWKTYDNEFSNLCNNFRSRILSSRIISLFPSTLKNYYFKFRVNNYINIFPLLPAHRAEGGINVSLLYNANHFNILEPLDNNDLYYNLRGINEYNSDNVMVIVLFNELLKLYGIKTKLLINNEIVFENKSMTIFEYLINLFDCSNIE